MTSKSDRVLIQNQYEAVPLDSPVMSPEGTPSTGDKCSPRFVVSKLRRSEDTEEQILSISTIAFDDVNSNKQFDADVQTCGAANGNHQHISPPHEPKIRPGGFRRILARFFATTFWQKRAKHFIPLTLLILYSATGGALFWFFEGGGRSEAYSRDARKRIDQMEADRNSSIDYLRILTDDAYTAHVESRMAEFEYAKITDLFYNYTVHENCTIDSNWTMSNTSDRMNLTVITDMHVLIRVIRDALNDTFSFDNLNTGIVNSVLFNLTANVPPPLEEDHDWSYWTAVFYAYTIYTTVGYGYVTAITDLGRALTMIYALFGIPLVLYTLNQLGRLMVTAIWKCYCAMYELRNLCCPVKYRVRSSKKVIAEFPFSAAVLITVAWMMMCSGIFCYLEKRWSFFLSLYFFFQSLTTIGFGDVKTNPEFLVWSFFLILIGLALFSMCWSLLQIKFDHLINMATQRITQKFVYTELEGGRMTIDQPSMKNEIEKITAGENAWLAAFLDENRRRVLMNEWRHRAKMSNKYVQTEIVRVDRGVQNVANSETATCQTPQFMSPEHQYKTHEIPYKEIRKVTTSNTGHHQPVINDECKAMFRGLRNILGECRDTLSSNKDLSSVETTPMHQFRATRSRSAVRKPADVSTTSTTASMSMIDF